LCVKLFKQMMRPYLIISIFRDSWRAELSREEDMARLRKIGVKISAEEVQMAVKKFMAQGGIVNRLPAQQNPSRMMGEHHGIYENLLDKAFSHN